MASTSHHHPILQENHQPKQAQAMNQIARGRSRRSSKKVQKKKKQPQRGMGVEQLERLRVQDQIKNSTIHGHNHQYYSTNFPNFTSATATAIAAVADPGIYSNSILNSSPILQFPQYCVSPNDLFVQQKVVNTGLIGSSTSTVPPTVPAVAFRDQFSHDHHFYSQTSQSGFATSKLISTEKPKELYSSMPNLFSSNNNSYFSDHCRSCNKKKRVINGEEISMSMITGKEDLGTKPLLQYPYTIQKGVEIVAIHTKGSSFAHEEGAVVMEYDFFPEKNGSSRNNSNTSCFANKMMMMSTNNSPETSSAAAAGNIGEGSSVTTITWGADTTITTPTSSIDLSLKLSY
ncbi:unnamed protein product [Withania somnifera]